MREGSCSPPRLRVCPASVGAVWVSAARDLWCGRGRLWRGGLHRIHLRPGRLSTVAAPPHKRGGAGRARGSCSAGSWRGGCSNVNMYTHSSSGSVAREPPGPSGTRGYPDPEHRAGPPGNEVYFSPRATATSETRAVAGSTTTPRRRRLEHREHGADPAASPAGTARVSVMALAQPPDRCLGGRRWAWGGWQERGNGFRGERRRGAGALARLGVVTVRSVRIVLLHWLWGRVSETGSAGFAGNADGWWRRGERSLVRSPSLLCLLVTPVAVEARGPPRPWSWPRICRPEAHGPMALRPRIPAVPLPVRRGTQRVHRRGGGRSHPADLVGDGDRRMSGPRTVPSTRT